MQQAAKRRCPLKSLLTWQGGYGVVVIKNPLMTQIKSVEGIRVGEELHPLGVSECPFCEGGGEIDTEGDFEYYSYICNDCEFSVSMQIIHKVLEIETPPLTAESDWCVCADCGSVAELWIEDENSRIEGHCGCWADCKECNTVTGVAKCPC